VADQIEACYTLEQIRVLDAYKTASEANYGIAEQHAAQIEALQDALEALVEAGVAQRVVADMRQQMLEEERRHNTYEKVGLYAIILALGVAAAN
jgi:hypothetical protein